jgi:hypothetical protein
METHDTQPEYQVQAVEFLRLLGYPRGHEPGARVHELMAWTRDWYARHGRPWVYLRPAELQIDAESLRLDGTPFVSRQLQEHLRHHGARSAMLLVASAGPECEEHARQVWTEGKPDEYFFLESYGSAVVEDLVARASGRICDLAAHRGLMAVPHYSPGYTGWDVADQNRLFSLITQGLGRPFPGPMELLSSGMLRPKKSLLAIFGLAPAKAGAATAPASAPCGNCSFSPCQYRRAPYRHAVGSVSDRARGQSQTSLAPAAPYTVNPRALRKWAAERVRFQPGDDGTIEAVFRFDGTTCSNQGQPLAFDYRVRLSGPGDGYVIMESSCAPAPGDDGYQFTCAYLADPDQHLREIAADRPLLGRRLEAVLGWERAVASAGCHCTADSRAHKWGLALEAIHYALVTAREPQAVS